MTEMQIVGSPWRKDFPFFENNPGFIYFDNAATTQKPQSVIDRICSFYAKENAPIGRSAYNMARKAEQNAHNARKNTAEFLGADENEIVFTKSATESANIVANAYALNRLTERNNVVVTALEHNSNFLPWQEICRKTGAELRIAALDKSGFPNLEDLERKVDGGTVITALTCASNVLHGVIPYEKAVQICRSKNSKAAVVLDATQLVAHKRVDVKKADCDFLFFSGHKMFAPLGSGVLYAKEERLEEMSPFLAGGGIVRGDDLIDFVEGAFRLEAGTQDVAARLGLASAIDYRNSMIEEQHVTVYEQVLSERMLNGFEQMEKYGVRILGDKDNAATPVFSFLCQGVHHYDIAVLLNHYQIAVRSGKMCAQNMFRELGVDGCVRASLCMYNTVQEVDTFLDALETVLKHLKRI